MREKPGEARFFTIHCQVHHHTLFKNIYVGHLHFSSSKCHILTSDTLSWHLFFKTLYSTSSALYHFLLHVSISTRFDWPIKRAIIHCTESRFPVASYSDVRLARLLLLILSLEQEHMTNPQERLGGRLIRRRSSGKMSPHSNLVPRVLSYPSLRNETGRRENLGTRLPALIPISRKKSGERRPNSSLFRRLFWSQFERGKTL